MKIRYLLLATFFIGGVSLHSVHGKAPIPGNRNQLLSGKRHEESGKKIWDTRYATDNYIYGKSPSRFLAQNFHYLPEGGRVLDIGMGEGRNGVYLATKGHKVVGVDISSVAVEKANRLAREYGVRIETIVSPMESYLPPKDGFDAIICFYYLDYKLNKKIFNWLRPGGILIFENYTTNQMKNDGVDNSSGNNYLAPSELLRLFPRMRILKYEEPYHLKNFTSSIILQKI